MPQPTTSIAGCPITNYEITAYLVNNIESEVNPTTGHIWSWEHSGSDVIFKLTSWTTETGYFYFNYVVKAEDSINSSNDV